MTSPLPIREIDPHSRLLRQTQETLFQRTEKREAKTEPYSWTKFFTRVFMPPSFELAENRRRSIFGKTPPSNLIPTSMQGVFGENLRSRSGSRATASRHGSVSSTNSNPSHFHLPEDNAEEPANVYAALSKGDWHRKRK